MYTQRGMTQFQMMNENGKNAAPYPRDSGAFDIKSGKTDKNARCRKDGVVLDKGEIASDKRGLSKTGK